nr:extracellular solute-binding protein [Kineosphaera limosa]
MCALAMTAAVGLSACGGSDTGAGNQLNWYINPDSGGNDPNASGQAHLAKVCTDASNGAYSIRTQVLPNSASDQRQQLLRRLAAGDRGVDMMSLDPVFVAEFAQAGFLAGVPQDKQAALTEDAVQPIIDSAQWAGSMYAAPMWANTQVLWYRKSVAEAAGLDMSQPVTWDQIIEAAKAQNKTVGVQARRYEGYAVWINALVEGAGGHIINNMGEQDVDKIEWGLDSDAGREAARVIAEVSSTGVGGPAMGGSDETAALDLFLGNSSGFLLNWPYVWAALDDRAPQLKDDVAWARYPQTVQGQESKPPLGGIELGVAAASQKQELAWQAIQCVTSQENQKKYMLGTGNPAARKAVYDDPEIREVFPMADLIRESLDSGAPRPVSQFYGDISGALQRSFSPPNEVNENTPAEAQGLIERVLKGESLL